MLEIVSNYPSILCLMLFNFQWSQLFKLFIYENKNWLLIIIKRFLKKKNKKQKI